MEAQLMRAALVEPFLLLLIPLVLLAWAYGRRGALLGSTWAAILHIGTGLWALQQQFFGTEFMAGSGLRVLLLYAVPLIVSILARREQRQIVELQRAYTRLQRHAATVEQLAVSHERNRLARDLHDTLAHSLAGLSVQLEALRTLIRRDPQAALEAVDEAAAVAKTGLEESRQAIGALRADPVTTMGLIGALRGELRALEARSGVKTELGVAGEESDLTEEEAQGLFRILQEALTNIERHASASHVSVELSLGADATDLTIRDDGVGFDPQADDGEQFGLTGMQERAAMLGGQLTVRSRSGAGSSVRCSLPR
jgi:signal transduction histidine kinase